MTSTPESISVLGVGQIGTALASAFLKQGHPVTVWNRTIEKLRPLTLKGARVAESPFDCVQCGTLVLVSLSSDEVVHNILGRIPTLLGRTIINFTTSRPARAEVIAEMVTKRALALGYLHGWINAMPSEVEDRQAAIRYSGPQALFERNKHIFQVLGEPLWLFENHKKICLLENAALLWVSGMLAAFFQSVALAEAAGADGAVFTRQVLLPLLPLFHGLLPQIAERGQSQVSLTLDESLSINKMLVLVSQGFEAAETSGVSTRLFYGFHNLLRQASELGNGHENVSILIRMLRNGALVGGR
ncbi:Glyoxylate/succinic semialdehyde reductase 1 [Penicillium rolfsii]|nr:Glyoxylate/succinic semialdehyde reductase 1 [Penicillium rolfsii]